MWAISNEKCNSLTEWQNMLVADLTESVNEIKNDNGFYVKRLDENVQTAVKKIREITQGRIGSSKQKLMQQVFR